MKKTVIVLMAIALMCSTSCKCKKTAETKEAETAGAVTETKAEEAGDLDAQYGTELLVPGTAAPDFELKDLDGKTVRLSDFRGKDVALVFWASWCPDCREEIPELKALYAGTDRSKLEFVSVSYDRNLETLKNFVKEDELPGVQLFDPAGKKDSGIGADYHIKWIPSLYLIDPDGKVALSTVMISKLTAALK